MIQNTDILPDEDLLTRQAKLLYPECEDWVIKLAVEAHMNKLKQDMEINEEHIETEIKLS